MPWNGFARMDMRQEFILADHSVVVRIPLGKVFEQAGTTSGAKPRCRPWRIDELLHVVADRLQWQTALAEARRQAAGEPPGANLSATGRAA